MEIQGFTQNKEEKVNAMETELRRQAHDIHTANEKADGVGQRLGERLLRLDREHGERQKVIHEFLAKQEFLINERLDEIGETFLECDELFKKMSAADPAGKGSATSAAPPYRQDQPAGLTTRPWRSASPP